MKFDFEIFIFVFLTFDSLINLNLAIITKGIIYRDRPNIIRSYL